MLDDIENLLSFRANVVPERYADSVLSVLIESLKKLPPPGHRLFVIGTTSSPRMVRTLGLDKYFQIKTELPPLDQDATQRVLAAVGEQQGVDLHDVATVLRASSGVPIKDLLFALHVAAHSLPEDESRLSADVFQRVWARVARPINELDGLANGPPADGSYF